MDNDLRRASVVALGELGRSRDYRDRADAGRGLAALAEMQEAVGPLLELMLDRDDTFVTRATAEAVLRRKDRVGLAMVASVLAAADTNHIDWIHTAIVDVFGVCSSDRDDAVRLTVMMFVAMLPAGLTHRLTDASAVLFAICRLAGGVAMHAAGRVLVTS